MGKQEEKVYFLITLGIILLLAVGVVLEVFDIIPQDAEPSPLEQNNSTTEVVTNNES